MSVTRKAPLDPLFEAAEHKYSELKALREAGRLPEKEFQAELQKLAVRDSTGRHWMIGGETGEWYVYEGSEWVRRAPPPAPPPAPIRVSLPPRTREGRRVSVRSERQTLLLQWGFFIIIGLVAGVVLAGISLLLNLGPSIGWPPFPPASLSVAEGQATSPPSLATSAVVQPTSTGPRPTASPTVPATASIPTETSSADSVPISNPVSTPAAPTRPPATATRPPPPPPAEPTATLSPTAAASPTVAPGSGALVVVQIVTDPATPPARGSFTFLVTFENSLPSHVDLTWLVGLFPAENPQALNPVGETTRILGQAQIGSSTLRSGTYTFNSGGEKRCFVARVSMLGQDNERIPMKGPGQNFTFCIAGP